MPVPYTTHNHIHRAEPVRLLLAEDDDAMRSFIAEALGRDGYEIVEVASGTELAAELDRLVGENGRAPAVDVVVSDIHMPGRSALDVLAQFHTVIDAIPIVLITAFGSDETHAQARDMGIAAVIDKPFDMDDLRTLLLNLAPDPRPSSRVRSWARSQRR